MKAISQIIVPDSNPVEITIRENFIGKKIETRVYELDDNGKRKTNVPFIVSDGKEKLIKIAMREIRDEYFTIS
jgi:hypothetical protein